MTAAIAVGILVAGGVYLILQAELLRVTVGFVLLGHAVNVLFVAAGGMERRGVPLIGQSDPQEAADPLPQAFVLTAIVITFGITVYLFGLLRAEGGDAGKPDTGTSGAGKHPPADRSPGAPGPSGSEDTAADGGEPAEAAGQVRERPGPRDREAEDDEAPRTGRPSTDGQGEAR
ncbi:hypothetical protein GCM10009716_10000 [Streptomyces sodiiphilus]|uniref:Cation:proton antiporter n=1 Tax=Streptomyces sodiiphilus TaxID=226217 RepID=A0ABN2NXL2_9ACTN